MPNPLLAQLASLEEIFQCRDSFRQFVKGSWHVIEPNTPFVDGWHIDAICEHLEALQKGQIKKLLIAMPPRHCKCVKIGSMILLANGYYKPIEEIQIGDILLSSDGTHVTKDKVVWKVASGKKRLIKITLNDGRTITTTAEHRLYGWNEWVEAGTLQVGDPLCVIDRTPDHDYRPYAGKQETTSQDAFLLALWLSEGTKGPEAGFQFTSASQAIRREAREIAKRRGWGYTWTHYTEENSRYRMRLTNKSKRIDNAPVQFLKDHGVRYCTTKTVHVPESIFRASNRVVARFIGTYIACDGYVATQAKSVGITTISERMALDLQLLLTRFEIHSTVQLYYADYQGKKFPAWRLLVSGADNFRKMAQHITIPDKQEKVEQLVATSSEKTAVRDVPPVWRKDLKHSPSWFRFYGGGLRIDKPGWTDKRKVLQAAAIDGDRNLEEKMTGGLGWRKIVAIEDDGVEETYDLETEKYHAFFAEGVLSHNSTLVSVCYPAWVWLLDPAARFLCASYALSLSLRDSTRCRALIDSDWYQEKWGDVFQWAGDQNLKARFETTAKGVRIATSVEGAATGEGGSCQEYFTDVQTDRGLIPLGEIVTRQLKVNVLSYNHSNDKLEYKPVTGYSSSVDKPCVAIVCGNGTHINCTDTHPFYVENRDAYIAAKDLQVGDIFYASNVREVRNDIQQKAMRDTKVTASLLQQGVLRSMEAREASGNNTLRSMREASLQTTSTYVTEYQSSCVQPQMSRGLATRREQPRVPGRKSRTDVRRVWDDIYGKEKCGGERVWEILQQAMHDEGVEGGRASTLSRLYRPLSKLWERTAHQTEQSGEKELLQREVCKYSTQRIHSRGKQPKLCGRWMQDDATSVFQRFQSNSTANKRTRRQSVRDVPYEQRTIGQRIGRASCRLRQTEQRAEQSYNALPLLSQQDTEQGRCSSEGVERVHVVSVTPIASIPVYNIQVADNHNYFGNTILSHNCLILDDCHNIQEAESDMVRQAALDWFDRVFVSRLNDQKTGKIVVIGQRVHEQDIIGHLKETGDWEYLMLPAEYIPEKRTKTSIGWKDPRKREGEVLWKEKFPKEVLKYLKKTLGIHYFSQYQQTPVRDQGNIFKSQYFLSYSDTDEYYVLHTPNGDEQIAKQHCRTILSTDLAVGLKAENDYTVILVWAVTPDMKFILIDIVHDRMESPDGEELIWTRAVSAKRLWGVIVEDAGQQKGTIQRLRRGTPVIGKGFRKGIPIIPYTPKGDKISRAQNMVVWMRSGNFYFNPNMSKYADLKKELISFPRTDHDDYVDGVTITQVLFEFGEPSMMNVDEEAMIANELAAIREIEKVDPGLADFLLEDMDIEPQHWWEFA